MILIFLKKDVQEEERKAKGSVIIRADAASSWRRENNSCSGIIAKPPENKATILPMITGNPRAEIKIEKVWHTPAMLAHCVKAAIQNSGLLRQQKRCPA